MALLLHFFLLVLVAFNWHIFLDPRHNKGLLNLERMERWCYFIGLVLFR
jgi:hypothetical protein